ncbi:MAG TPA: M56 family metallopeptidase [Rhodanobacteraceae bacterium]|nr:M56 family metallopeptidase [Rhodanobacteraceae bacterium]
MADMLLRMLVWTTFGLALVLVLRRPARHAFGAGSAFTLWLLPVVLALGPLLPRGIAPAAVMVLPAVSVTAHAPVVFASLGVHASWDAVLAGLWLAGVALGSARLAWHHARLRRGARHGSPAWLDVVRRAAPGMDMRRVRVHASGPAVLGSLPRALVLLPEDFAERFDTLPTRALVLRHELTHVRRGDAWWTLAMELATVLIWFHPLAWLARSRFCLDQELACDAASLRELPECTPGYARALIDSVAAHPVTALIPWLAEPQLKERITMLSRTPPGTLRRRAGFLAVTAMLAGGLFLAGAHAPVHAAAPPAQAAPAVDITFKNAHPPRYPVAAVKHGEQGTVMLDVTISASGNVEHVAVDAKRSDASPALQQAALAAAANWKFKPGLKNGKPVGGVVRIPVNFSLGGPKGAAGGACPPGFQYKQGEGKSYSCIHEQPKASAAAI